MSGGRPGRHSRAHEAPVPPVPTRPDWVVMQPALAARTTRLLRFMAVGVLCGVVMAGAMVMASASMVRVDRRTELWPMAANVCAMLLALVAVMQFYLWWRARQEWSGQRDVALGSWLLPSRFGAWASYLLLVATPVSGLMVAGRSTVGDRVWWLALVGSVLSVFVVLFAARFWLDPVGPPGSVPALIRRNRPSSPPVGGVRAPSTDAGSGGPVTN